jgi:hypothetical protein
MIPQSAETRFSRTFVRRALATLAAGALLPGPLACSTNSNGSVGPDEQTALHMLMPAAVKIQPFTQATSFDDDGIPDGIELMVQPVDRIGDPVKVVGRFTFELWTYRAASADRKGRQLQFWEVVLDSDKDQQRFWDRTAMMYVFNLDVVPGAVPPGEDTGPIVPGKLVVVAAYHTPSGEHLVDEFDLDVRDEFRALPDRVRSQAGG